MTKLQTLKKQDELVVFAHQLASDILMSQSKRIYFNEVSYLILLHNMNINCSGK